MAEFLIYAFDSATITPPLSTQQLAERFKLFDLISWNPDGFGWADQELVNPVFRLVSILNVSADLCDSLISPILPTFDTTGLIEQTYVQPRSHYINLLDPSVSQALPDAVTWWNDTTRAVPMYHVPADCPLSVSSLILARPAITVAS